jgi:hypothetical protein
MTTSLKIVTTMGDDKEWEDNDGKEHHHHR